MYQPQAAAKLQMQLFVELGLVTAWKVSDLEPLEPSAGSHPLGTSIRSPGEPNSNPAASRLHLGALQPSVHNLLECLNPWVFHEETMGKPPKNHGF